MRTRSKIAEASWTTPLKYELVFLKRAACQLAEKELRTTFAAAFTQDIRSRERRSAEALQRAMIQQCFYAWRYDHTPDPFKVFRVQRREASKQQPGLVAAAQLLKAYCLNDEMRSSRLFEPLIPALAAVGLRYTKRPPPNYKPISIGGACASVLEEMEKALSSKAFHAEDITPAYKRIGCLQFGRPIPASRDASLKTETMLWAALASEIARYESGQALRGTVPRIERKAALVRLFVLATFGERNPEILDEENGRTVRRHVARTRQGETVDRLLREHPNVMVVGWPEENSFGLHKPKVA